MLRSPLQNETRIFLGMLTLSVGGLLPACAQQPNGSSPGVAYEVGLKRWNEFQQSKVDCVSKAGFKYFPEAFEFSPKFPRYLDIPFSTVEAEKRSREGYGMARTQKNSIYSATQSLNAKYASTLSADDQSTYRGLIYGTSGNWGCGEAIFPTREIEKVTSLRDAVFPLFTSNDEIIRLNRVWSECMKRAGYNGAERMWAVESEVVGESVDVMAGRAESVERDIGKADVNCYSGNLRRINEIRLEIEREQT